MSFQLIHCVARVLDSTTVMLDADEIPAKLRKRHWMHNWPPGTKLNAQVWYQVDRYHGRDHIDVFVRNFAPVV